LSIQASVQDNTLKIEHKLDPGDAGAPMLSPDGKVVAIATSANLGIPIEVARKLIP